MSKPDPIGYIIGGSLRDSFSARLVVEPSKVQEGSFVVTDSGTYRFYGLVTDIRLGSTDPRFADEQTERKFPPIISRALQGQTLFTNLEILPQLMLERGPDPLSPEYDAWRKEHSAEKEPRLLPVKTVPMHHSSVALADGSDIATIFGSPQDVGNFEIGSTREQGHPICINLDRFVQRSSGVFGATGTGKSFLTRLVLAGLMQYNKASVFVLDMHNEYGYDDIASDTKKQVIGLKTKFKSRVKVVGLGAGAFIRQKQRPDFDLEVAMKDISIGDIEMLSRTLNLRETAPTVLSALESTFGSQWFGSLKKMNRDEIEVEDERGKIKKVPHPESVAAWAGQNGVNVMAAEGLFDKMRRLFNKKYIVEKPGSDGIKEIITNLQNGNHVVLSFGDHETDLDYLLVANLITRLIREAWEKSTNEFRAHGQSEPRPLVIVLEEAHKLLNREIANQTSFATIARELRKYYVTLLVVDQRPSQIYDEVMSQLGTRISGWLGDEDDIHAVLSGLAGREAIKGMLARLQPKEEVLLMGWGVPMPLPIRSRRYDQQFWDQLMGSEKKVASEQELIKKLGF